MRANRVAPPVALMFNLLSNFDNRQKNFRCQANFFGPKSRSSCVIEKKKKSILDSSQIGGKFEFESSNSLVTFEVRNSKLEVGAAFGRSGLQTIFWPVQLESESR